MATLENQQPWIPYEMTNDCSQGFCSIYCPQWCYVIFPPPPPFGLSDDDRSSVTSFSPLVIAIIGVLMSVFLLVTYYVVLSKYCGRNLGRRPAGEPDETVGREAGRRPMNGLDEALVDKITVYKYKSGEGMINATDCSVCLGEFREGESLRLLPECEHAFHLRCIDTWLKSHSNCPLCRANIVWVESSVLPAPPPLEPESNPDIGEAVAVVEDVNRGGGEESDLGNEEFRNPVGGGVQPMRRSFSLDSSTQWRVLIDDAMLTNRGSQNPGPMKRSLSSGRFCFAWHGREKSPVLPM